MVIGEEDGSDSFSDDQGSDDSSGWRLRGWAASAARGGVGVVALGGRWVWMRSGRFSLSRARGRWGVSREGEWQSGAERRRRFRCVSREGGFRTRREREFGLGRGGRRGSRFIWQTGCCENAERRRPQQRRRGRQDRTGTGSDSIRGGDGIGGFCDTDSNDDRDGEDRDSDDGDSRGRGLSAETWAAIRPSGSKVRLGTKFAIEDSSSDRDDGSNFSDEGDSDSISDDPEQRRQRGPGQQRQRRRQRGRWRVV